MSGNDPGYRFEVCLHEAGHVIAHRCLGHTIHFARIQIDPTERHRRLPDTAGWVIAEYPGLTWPDGEPVSEDIANPELRRMAEDAAVVLMAGEWIASYWFGTRFPVEMTRDQGDGSDYAKTVKQLAGYPWEVKREIVKQAKARIKALFDEPQNMLAVLRIAHELDKQDTLRGEDIDWILDGEEIDLAKACEEVASG